MTHHLDSTTASILNHVSMAVKPLCMLDGCQTYFLNVKSAKYYCCLLCENINATEKWRMIKTRKSLLLLPPTCLVVFCYSPAPPPFRSSWVKLHHVLLCLHCLCCVEETYLRAQ